MSTSEVVTPSTEPFGKIRLSEKDVLDTDSTKTIVSLRNIHKTYLLGVEGVPALRGVSVSISRGEFVCIYGTSGGGMSKIHISLQICGSFFFFFLKKNFK